MDNNANPKQIYGNKKPSLCLFPVSAQIAGWEAFQDGAIKYGPYNWRERPVEIQTYIEAAMRHLRLFEAGEEKTRDTNVQNLGAVIACCGIIIDAMAHGTAIDNRPISPESAELIHKAENMVAHFKELYNGH